MKLPVKVLLFSILGLGCGYLARRGMGVDTSTSDRPANAGAGASAAKAGTDLTEAFLKLRAKQKSLAPGAEPNLDEWVRDLTPLLRAQPKRTMAFIFHELPPELSLKLLPLLGPVLSGMDDRVIRDALSSVRTAKEMKVAWGAVVAARFKDSPESAVKLARIAPPGGDAAVQLVKAAAGGGTADLLRLADAGADKSWFLLPYTGEPEWLKNAPITSSLELLHGLQAKFAGKWTDRDTFLFAVYAPLAAADRQAFFAELVKTTLSSARSEWTFNFVRDCAANSPDNLKLLFDAMPESYQKRKLAQDALARIQPWDTKKQAAVRDSLPPLESVSAIRKPLMRAVEDNVMMEGHGGARHHAYDLAATAEPVDQPFLIKYAVDATKKVFGISGVLRSLPDANDSALTDTVYAEAARMFIRDRGDGFKEDEMKALQTLTPEQVARLRTAVAQGGSESLAGLIH